MNRFLPSTLTAAAQPTTGAEIRLLVLLATLFGMPYALTKIALQTITPMTLVAARVCIAAALLWCAVFAFKSRIDMTWNLAGRLLIQAFLNCILPYTLTTYGQQTVDSALAAVLNSASPIFVALITLIWTRHEAVTVSRVVGVLVGIGGIASIAGSAALSGLGSEMRGQAAIILATVSLALAVIRGRNLTEIPPEVSAAATLTWSAIVLVPIALIVEAPLVCAPSVPSATALAANAVFGTGAGFLLYFRLIRTLGTMGTASVSYLKTGVGVLIGCVVLGEPFSWALFMSLAAIVIGVVAINSPVGQPGPSATLGCPNRSMRNGAIGRLVFPPVTSSAMIAPTIGPSAKPWAEKPKA
jgi:drug/metabolite transporter (DMT)-like permease